MKKIKLKPGEGICDKCKGKRRVPTNWEHDVDINIIYICCPKCHGTGKLDWVEKVCGKKTDALKTVIDMLGDAIEELTPYNREEN